MWPYIGAKISKTVASQRARVEIASLILHLWLSPPSPNTNLTTLICPNYHHVNFGSRSVIRSIFPAQYKTLPGWKCHWGWGNLSIIVFFHIWTDGNFALSFICLLFYFLFPNLVKRRVSSQPPSFLSSAVYLILSINAVCSSKKSLSKMIVTSVQSL